MEQRACICTHENAAVVARLTIFALFFERMKTKTKSVRGRNPAPALAPFILSRVYFAPCRKSKIDKTCVQRVIFRLLPYGRDSPLRPEMAESTLALYRETGSMKYLRVGESLLRALQANSRVACGYASVGDVDTGEMEDRMDSFFIAETLKYLFLLFDG